MKVGFKTYRKIDIYRRPKDKSSIGRYFAWEYLHSTNAYRTCGDALKAIPNTRLCGFSTMYAVDDEYQYRAVFDNKWRYC